MLKQSYASLGANDSGDPLAGIAKDEDEQYLKGIMDLVGAKGKSKEVDELVAKLDINPNDTVSERLLKQTSF